jgi:hypothetical protein
VSLLRTEETVSVRAVEYVSSVQGDMRRKTELELGKWGDGTLVLGPFLINENAFMAAVGAAKEQMNFARKTSEPDAKGVSTTVVQRCIVPSLAANDPGVLVVWEKPRWYWPFGGHRVCLQRAEHGLMAAPAIYELRPGELDDAIKRAPLQPGDPPRPGRAKGPKPTTRRSRRRR